MCRKYSLLVSLILLLSIAAISSAADDVIWTNGGLDGDWNNTANWSPAQIPNATSDRAKIKMTTGPVFSAGRSATAFRVFLGIDGTDGRMTIDGGSLTTNSYITLGEAAGDNSTLTINSGSLTTLGASVGYLFCGKGGNATMNMNGGTVTTAAALYVGLASGGNGVFNLSGGTVTVATTLYVARDSGSNGLINLSGGSISCGSLSMRTYGGTGVIDITNGTLIIDDDALPTITPYVTNGWITAFGDTGTVLVDYNVTNPGKTTIRASASPDPTKARRPSPGDGTIGVSLHTVLSWDANSEDTSYDIYLGLDANAVAQADTNSSEYLDTICSDSNRMEYAVTLKPYTQYFWCVDINTGGDITVGEVLDFTTGFDYFENIKNATVRRYNVNDDTVHPMDCLKVIQPDSNTSYYLAVYHSYISGRFDVRLADSSDLTDWTYVCTLATYASQPTIAYHPESAGFYVAYEKGGVHFRYYPSLSSLLAGTYTRDWAAPKTLGGSYPEGTPDIRSISPDGNTLEVGFHYWWLNGIDRIAHGTATNFFTGSPGWSTYAETELNNNLIAKGVGGDIGDRDNGRILNRDYIMQETQFTDGDWSSWRIWLYDFEREDYFFTSPVTDGGSYSFGNGTFTSLVSPSGKDAVVGTYFLFGEGAGPGEAGPVLFYNEIQTEAWTPVPQNGATGIERDTTLRWLCGADANGHDVYLGTDSNSVAAADSNSPTYENRVSKPHIDLTSLLSNTQYFWRVDEIASDGTKTIGDVWSFTTERLAGDIDGIDGVNRLDLEIFAQHWLDVDQPGCEADLDGDCKVNFLDFAILAGNWLER